MNVRIRCGLAAAAVGVLALTACGSNSLGGEPAAEGSSAPTTSASVNADLAAKLPESIKSSGVIKIGTDSSYAPNEFLAADGKTVEGFEVDLFKAVARNSGSRPNGKARTSGPSSTVSLARSTTWGSRPSPSTTSARSKSPW